MRSGLPRSSQVASKSNTTSRANGCDCPEDFLFSADAEAEGARRPSFSLVCFIPHAHSQSAGWYIHNLPESTLAYTRLRVLKERKKI